MIRGFKEHKPEIAKDVFIADNTSIIGQVKIAADCSIWYGAVLRADENSIQIGAKSNVQDGTVVHVGHHSATIIGEGVTIGHNAIIHGCQIGDYTLVGMGATVLDGAQIGKHCLIGANSLITANTVIPDGSLVLGAPAKVIKPLTEEQIQSLYQSADHYCALAKVYMEES